MLKMLKNHVSETENAFSWLRDKLKHNIPGLREDEIDEHMERFEGRYIEAMQYAESEDDIDVNALARETLKSAREAYGDDEDLSEDNFLYPYPTGLEDEEFAF